MQRRGGKRERQRYRNPDTGIEKLQTYKHRERERKEKDKNKKREKNR